MLQYISVPASTPNASGPGTSTDTDKPQAHLISWAEQRRCEGVDVGGHQLGLNLDVGKVHGVTQFVEDDRTDRVARTEARLGLSVVSDDRLTTDNQLAIGSDTAMPEDDVAIRAPVVRPGKRNPDAALPGIHLAEPVPMVQSTGPPTSPEDGRVTIRPRHRHFELACEPDQHVLGAVTGNDLHPDGQPGR